MPIGFLTTSERDRLNRFPVQIPDEELRVFFLFSDADQTAINTQREAHTRLGFARQLCALRYLGFAPDDLRTAPWAAVGYGAQHLTGAPDARAADGRRMPTRTLHLQHVQAHQGFRPAAPLELSALHMWLVERT